MTKAYPVPTRHIVRNYNKYEPKENRYYFKPNEQILKKIRNWDHVRRFFRSECDLILGDKIELKHKNGNIYEGRDILFEYLLIRAVTFLEICLKVCCSNYVKELPDRAARLLTNVKDDKDLSVQVLSNYSFTNIRDIEHVFSTLWGKHYFQVLRHRSEEMKSCIGYEEERPRRASPLFKKMGMFKELLKTRNKLVHEDIAVDIRYKKIRKDLVTTIYDVILHTWHETYNFPYDENSFKMIVPDY